MIIADILVSNIDQIAAVCCPSFYGFDPSTVIGLGWKCKPNIRQSSPFFVLVEDLTIRWLTPRPYSSVSNSCYFTCSATCRVYTCVFDTVFCDLDPEGHVTKIH